MPTRSYALQSYRTKDKKGWTLTPASGLATTVKVKLPATKSDYQTYTLPEIIVRIRKALKLTNKVEKEILATTTYNLNQYGVLPQGSAFDAILTHPHFQNTLLNYLSASADLANRLSFRKLDVDKYPGAYAVTRELAAKAGMEMPLLQLQPATKDPVAMARLVTKETFQPSLAFSAVTFDLLTLEELRGIIAHELGHLHRADYLVSAAAKCAGRMIHEHVVNTVWAAGNRFEASLMNERWEAWRNSEAAKLSQAQETAADVYAKKLGYADDLKRALGTWHYHDLNNSRDDFSNPDMSSHPPVVERMCFKS